MLKSFPELTLRNFTQNRAGQRKLDDLIFHARRGKNTAAVAVVGVNKCHREKLELYAHDLVHTPRVTLLYGYGEHTALTVLWVCMCRVRRQCRLLRKLQTVEQTSS